MPLAVSDSVGSRVALLETDSSQSACEEESSCQQEEASAAASPDQSGDAAMGASLNRLRQRVCRSVHCYEQFIHLLHLFRRRIAFACITVACLLAVSTGGLLTGLVLLIGLLSAAFTVESHLVYCNNEPPDSRYFVDHPSRYNLPSQTVFLDSNGARLHCYFIKQPEPACRCAPTLLFLHGNAGNVGHRLPNCVCLYQQCRVNMLLLDYRGYGLSSGNPSESGLYADAAAALAFLSRRSDIDTQRIVLFGRSLGGAVAVELASRLETASMASGLVLENTFTSLPEAASSILRLPYLRSLPAYLMLNRYNSRRKISNVRLPTLVLSGLKDTLIPPSMSASLFDACSASVRRIEKFEEGEHNSTWQCPGYFQKLNNFLHYGGLPTQDNWQAAGSDEEDEAVADHVSVSVL